MPRIEKSVFISYRRTNVPWALNVYQDLTHHGYDVFFDFEGIGSGDFESIIVDNITSRAHFLVLLTPSALERCNDPGDWLRREMEVALQSQRNIVPLMLEGFSFGTPSIANQLTGTLAPLKSYNGLSIPVEYFPAAMDKLRTRFLNISLTAVLHPATPAAQKIATEQKQLANAAPAAQENDLISQQCFENGVATSDPDEQIRFYTEAIRLRPHDAISYSNRATSRKARGDLEAALLDCDEAIRLKPDFAVAYYNRAIVRAAKGDRDAALIDFSAAIQLRSDDADAYYGRANIHLAKLNLDAALADYNEAIRLLPNDSQAHNNRGIAKQAKNNQGAALLDYNEAIRLDPKNASAYYNRGNLLRKLKPALALASYKQYLKLGGDNDEKVRGIILELEKLSEDTSSLRTG